MMRITSKGQVTIPQEVRERAGFMPNTEVDFVIDGDLVYLVKSSERGSRPTRGQLVVEHLRRHGASFSMTTDELMALTRGED
jgi:AbrB family looped-hinge helix DNA binding protein